MQKHYLGRILSGKVIGFMLPFTLFLFAIIIIEIVFPINVLVGGIVFTLLFSSNGILIDFENKRMKIYKWVLFLRIGKWESLLNYDGYFIKKIYEGHSLTYGQVTSASYESFDFGLFLINSKKNHSVLIKKGNVSELKQFSEEIKVVLPDITYNNTY